mmetsp:Transcript_11812/g.34976  ORF Transcript_11812/g.34976 Transcript_11812/m.34976 type:complete len:213 (-) Transcript_11812:46-684(-)
MPSLATPRGVGAWASARGRVRLSVCDVSHGLHALEGEVHDNLDDAIGLHARHLASLTLRDDARILILGPVAVEEGEKVVDPPGVDGPEHTDVNRVAAWGCWQVRRAVALDLVSLPEGCVAVDCDDELGPAEDVCALERHVDGEVPHDDCTLRRVWPRRGHLRDALFEAADDLPVGPVLKLIPAIEVIHPLEPRRLDLAGGHHHEPRAICLRH